MATRLIDVPFTRGIDESVDETVAALPAMTELVNYRLTRAGRLEHRLGVTALGLTLQVVSSNGGKIDFTKSQGINGRFVATSGHGHTALTFGQWSCNGSLSRYVPIDSFPGLGISSRDYDSPSATSIFGFLVVAARETLAQSVKVVAFDEATGVPVRRWTAGSVAGSPDNRARVVACGTTLVVVTQDNATGIISQETVDMTSVPLANLGALTTVAVAAAPNAGFDAAPIDEFTYLLSCYEGGAAVYLRVIDAATGATLSSAAIAAAGGYTTCISSGSQRYMAWMDSALQTVRAAVFDSALVQIGATQTVGTATSTVLSTNRFHPVLGVYSGGVIVGWVNSSSVATGGTTYSTFRTNFRELSSAAVLGTTYGPLYGTYLASKPFFTSTAFVEGIAQPAVWLANYNPTTAELDRSYFLHTIGTATDSLFTLEMSASPSAAVAIGTVMGTLPQVCEVVANTGPYIPTTMQTVLLENFRGVGTSTPQRRAQVYRFGDAARSMRARTRCLVPAQGGLAVLGGAPRYYDSSWLNELGIAYGPTIMDAVPAATGSMTPGATYRYVFVIEYFDNKGQRVLSYVSSPRSVTLGGGDAQVNFCIQGPVMWAEANASSISDPRAPVVRAYRTAANVGTVFRYAPATGSPNGVSVGSAETIYQDVNSDASIAGNEAIYVQVGNALSNYRAPPCRFGCEHEGRLVVAGGWKPNEFYSSKLFFPGEGIQFTESAAFVGVCPEPITGMASLDGSLVLFGERAIYTVTGDGPLDDGTGSFSTPRRLPGRIGCVDWRSVVTVPDGVFFRSLDGIYMLPRGLASPSFVGGAIKESLREFPETLAAATCTRAVASSVNDHDSEQVVAWLVGNAESPTSVAIFVLSLSTNSWSRVSLPTEGGNPHVVMGVWNDLANGTDVLAFARRELESTETAALQVENPGTGYDRDISGSFEPLLAGSWKTGKLFPFGFGGRGSIRSIRIVGECLAATTLTPTIWHDADTAGATHDTLTFAPGRFAVEIPFRRRDLAWVQIQVADPTTGSGNRGAGLRFNGLALEVEMEAGLHRTAPNERST